MNFHVNGSGCSEKYEPNWTYLLSYRLESKPINFVRACEISLKNERKDNVTEDLDLLGKYSNGKIISSSADQGKKERCWRISYILVQH